MDNTDYYGLFLLDRSRKELKEWLTSSKYLHSYLTLKKVHLDHCTLLHHSQFEENSGLKRSLEFLASQEDFIIILPVDGIGKSDKAFAFRVFIPPNTICANKIAHITIGTFEDGKPVDSNDITEWEDIEPMYATVQLRKRDKCAPFVEIQRRADSSNTIS